MAKNGDTTAMGIMMDRLIAPRKDGPIQASLGEIKTLDNLTTTASKSVETFRKSVETNELKTD